MNHAPKKLLYVKDFTETNSQEHAYCQVKEKPKQEDYDIQHISDNTPIMQEDLGLLNRECKNNISGNFKLNKTIQAHKDHNNVDKIICSESGETDKNDFSEINSCSDISEEHSSSENSSLKNNTIIWSSGTNVFGKRKLHKSYIISWGTQLSCDGFARCLIETCNFISLDLHTMQEHYKTCDGVQILDYNLCKSCNHWLTSETDLIIHQLKCRNKAKSSFKSPSRGKGHDDVQIEQAEIINNTMQSASCRNTSEDQKAQISTEGIKYCDQCEQYFLTDQDYSQHLISCKPNSSERPSVIKKIRDPTVSVIRILKDKIDEEDKESLLIQPGRNIPKGEYVRRRAYTKQHKAAWEAAIEKYKYVKCIFQNCHFLALSVEDMISHYGYCNGDGSFAKFPCPFCGGRVTDEKFLEIHIRRSHPSEQYDEINSYFANVITQNEDSYTTLERENKESVQQTCTDRRELGFSPEDPQDIQLEQEDTGSHCEEMEVEPSDVCDNEARVKESSYLSQDDKSGYSSQIEECGNACESLNDSTNVSNFQDTEDEELNLSKEQNSELMVRDSSLNTLQKIRHSPKITNEREYKDDHIYFKRKNRTNSDSELKDSLSVMKNKNLKHYSGPKNVNEEKEILRVRSDEVLLEHNDRIESEEELLSNKSISDSDNSGKYVRQMIKFSFPTAQNSIKREVHPSYTNLWTESIKANGFARCLVATCNFISLDIFHMENHFKTCNGVPEDGPNLCTFCNSRLPSAVELWIHSSMCKANGEINASLTNISEAAEECQNHEASYGIDEIGGSSNAEEFQDPGDLHENYNNTGEGSNSFKRNKETRKTEVGSKKEKLNSLRISDIIKLKDNGTMDYNRIIQPGPILPKGQYIRRRSYTKTHKAVWEAALEKHKYVKCIFQNCHFLAMSLEDMIYHFGYCIGDGSFAQFECPHCGGRLTTKIVLDIHIQVSHSDKISSENDQNLLPSNEEREELLYYSLDDWKKLIAKKEIKTYGKSSPRSKIFQTKICDVVSNEDAVETNEDDSFNREPSESLESRHQISTIPVEVQMEDRITINNFVSETTTINEDADFHMENQRFQNNNVDNKSSDIETPEELKSSNEFCSDLVDERKTYAHSQSETGEGMAVDMVEAPDDRDTFEDRSDSIIRSPKNSCGTEEYPKISCEESIPIPIVNPSGQEKSPDMNDNALSLVSDNESSSQKQDTESEMRSLRERNAEEGKNSNETDEATKSHTEAKRKRGRISKSLVEESLSEREHTEEVLGNPDSDKTSHQDNNAEESEEPDRKIVKLESLENQCDPTETPNPTPRRRGRPPKRRAPSAEAPEVELNKVEKETSESAKSVRHRGKRKNEIQENNEKPDENVPDIVKCAKCDFEGKRKLFKDHNFKKHVGLSWIEGEDPIDPNDESTVSWNIKQAFKHIKSATCANCGDVKRSALGFISHMQNCGKSEEEKNALKVTCPYCPARILKYSLPVHLKLSHSDSSEGNKTSKEYVADEEHPAKRKSALRAVHKFHEVLKQYGDEDDTKRKTQYVVYEKGVSKFPKLPPKIRGLWNKMIREKKQIPCRRGSCLIESSSIQEARNHHFLCSELPDRCYVCQLCDYYSTSESSIEQHMNIHPKRDGDFTVGSEDERLEEEVEMKESMEDEVGDLVQNKSKTSFGSSEENSLETAYKTRFFARERLSNERQTRFCRRSLRMTFETEMDELEKGSLILPEMHTKASDWIPVESKNVTKHFPGLEESISFHINNDGKTIESDWKTVKRFMGNIVGDTAVIFTGGSVLSMSWCKYSCIRSSKQNLKQYLAVSSSKKMDKFQDIHEECSDFSGLIQIYSCGEMKTLDCIDEVPKMVIGIIHDSGEVWDLSWFPLDSFEECYNKKLMTRVGLLGAACQDGTVRIWPVCDPDELKSADSFPLYRIDAKVILELEDKPDVGCLRLAVGRTGIVVGGYANGIVAVWNLRNISSPFCKKTGNSLVLKPHISFQAHRTSITALSMCQNSDRYICTSGLDRFIKFWDLECPENPFESVQREVCLDNVWPKHWPLTISTFENIVPCSGKGMIKAIRDVYCDKHRTPLALESTCWSLSFNEWLNVLCGCNNVGEVKIRYLRNMFLADEKFRLKTGNIFCTTELRLLKDTGKEKVQEKTDVESCKGNSKISVRNAEENIVVPRTYEEAQKYFGLIFNDSAIEYDSKQKTNSSKTDKKDDQSIEEYPIASVNKVCWNPNYKKFMQLAIGHHCGLIRIKPLKDANCREEVLRFLTESEEEISKLSVDSSH